MPVAETLLLLTRPRKAAERFRTELPPELDLPVLIAPLIAIDPVGDPVDLAGIGTVIFTSANAVDRVIPAPGSVAWCVGDRTAAVARAAGFDARSVNGTADILVARLLRERPAGPVLHVRGHHGRGQVAQRLTDGGLPCQEVIVYRQRDLPLDPDAIDRIAAAKSVILPLFSPRSARRAAMEIPSHPGLRAIAISAAAADAWAPRGKAAIAPHPGTRGMIEALRLQVASDRSC